MIFSLAPMEGVTGHVFRRAHAEVFGALDRYYTPFLTPPRQGSKMFGKRDAAEVDPETNAGLTVIPQLIGKDAGEFIWAAQLLADLGYTEVNLNLGCPSGTVVNKGRGSGFLRNLAELDRFLDEVCEGSPIPVSVKTRIGIEDDAEYEAILAMYARHPLAELIVHPRVQKDAYRGRARRAAYGATLEAAPFPVAYNGDIFSEEDFQTLVAAYPETRHVMVGRGIVTAPALVRRLSGGDHATREELRRFHDALFAAYEEEMGGNAVFRMKEWWFYAKFSFAEPIAVTRAVRKVRKAAEYEAAAERIFSTLALAEEPRFQG